MTGIRYRICDWVEGMRRLKPASAHLALLDPPYGGITDNDWDTVPDWGALTNQLDRVLDDTGTLYVFGRQPSLIEAHLALRHAFILQAEYIWHKGMGLWTGGNKPRFVHENVWWYRKATCKAGDITFNLEEIGTPAPVRIEHLRRATAQTSPNQRAYTSRMFETRGLNAPPSILNFSKVSFASKEYRGHPTQKPIALLAWLIRAATLEGDLVVDPFVGSGSTLYAAAATGRRAVGFERNPAFENAIKGALAWEAVRAGA